MRFKAPIFKVIYSLTVLGAAAFSVWQFAPPAESAEPEVLNTDEPFNFDIRTGQIKKSYDRSGSFRLEYNQTLNIPEIIAPESGEFLTPPADAGRTEILRRFLRENAGLFGLNETQIAGLKTAADYTNPDGNLSFVHLDQRINGIPVFQGEIKAGFTKNGEIIRIVNNLAPHLDDEQLSDDFGEARAALFKAAGYIGAAADENDVRPVASDDLKITFERGQFAERSTAEKFYFPLAAGVARPAWRVLLWTRTAAFYVIVDASDGTLLWRKNITENQTLPATYNVYGNTTGFLKTADSPAPCTPGCNDPNNCPQPAAIGRSDFTLIGNEPPYSFNNLGWIPDTGLPVRTPADPNITDGNNVEAGIDRDGQNGVDPMGHAFGNPSRVFSYAYNPAPGIPPPGDDPLPPNPQPYPPTPFQQGVAAHGFYLVNRWHDEMYRLGFTETANNFQHFNFGRGGVEGDRISFEMQDSSGTNGANFATPADGGRGRMQMFIWTGPTPPRDGALDGTVVLHEITHGLSNRLHGNSSGLGSNMARGMGEGWSDFYALALLSEPADDPCGVYPVGGYITLNIIPGFTANHYYGIRRFPTARRSCLGPNGMPHNPLTFGNINAGNCTTFPSAFPRGPIGTSQCDQVHNAGEVWAQALWEVRGFLMTAHGAAEGNRRALQYITDGMKLAPLNPTFLQERDAILAAAAATDPADVRRVWRGFAARGIGVSARINTVSPINVTEAFDTPNVVIGNGFAVSDAPGNNNGYPEPGEPLRLTIPLSNNTGATITGVTLQVAGGASAFYGDIANGQTVIQNINFVVPVTVPCPGEFVLVFNINSSEGPSTETRTIFLGIPVGGFSQNFDTVTAPMLPAGWTTNNAGAGSPALWTTTSTGSDTAPNSAFTNNPATSGESSLETPPIPITSANAQVNFRLKYNTENNFDGLVLEIRIGAGAYTDIVAAGGSFMANGYNGTLGTGSMNPLGGRMAWTGNSANYVTVKANLPASANGQEIRLRWRMGSDNSVGATGVNVDTVMVVSGYVCGDFFPKGRFDFDGDGRTDISVYRPSEGNWYLNNSLAGFSVINWGIAADRPVPGDYDGDRRTDTAVFRATTDPAQPDFYVLNSSGFTFAGYSWGLPNDLPVIADYNGDGKDDIAVFRPSNHTFYVLESGTGNVQTFSNIQFGSPVTGDFDGDGKADFASYSIDGWFLAPSNINYSPVTFTRWGASGDKPVPADYDGDGKDDFAVFRPSDRTWYIRRSSGGNTFVQFGLSGDTPVPGDYDGDARADIAVYRNGTWYVNGSTSGVSIINFGLSSDLPIPNSFLP